MNCQKCGEVCSCPMEPVISNGQSEEEIPTVPAARLSVAEKLEAETDSSSAWRDELASRLNRYRARRKAPPPRYPSLRLPFDRIEATAASFAPVERVATPTFEPASNNALALDGMHQTSSSEPELHREVVPYEPAPPAVPLSILPQTAKIIEFPRFAWAPPSPPPDQLAEPVMDRPRILEVPEVAPPPPALGGITIEPVAIEEPEKQRGVDVPLQSAALGRRLLASIVDGVIISAAAALFGVIFWKVSGITPPRLQMLGIAAGLLAIFWAAYHYVLLVYSGRTPGLLLARLELTRFDGSPVRRSLRRWRILASFLSALSLGMGYVWVFLDEDSLCWHDRITRTYLAPQNQTRTGIPQN